MIALLLLLCFAPCDMHQLEDAAEPSACLSSSRDHVPGADKGAMEAEA